jgi:hypothetical protein
MASLNNCLHRSQLSSEFLDFCSFQKTTVRLKHSWQTKVVPPSVRAGHFLFLVHVPQTERNYEYEFGGLIYQSRFSHAQALDNGHKVCIEFLATSFVHLIWGKLEEFCTLGLVGGGPSSLNCCEMQRQRVKNVHAMENMDCFIPAAVQA